MKRQFSSKSFFLLGKKKVARHRENFFAFNIRYGTILIFFDVISRINNKYSQSVYVYMTCLLIEGILFIILISFLSQAKVGEDVTVSLPIFHHVKNKH